MANLCRQDDFTVVELDRSYDALDEQPIEALTELLLREIETRQPVQLVLDFSNTVYISSRVLEVLFRSWKRVKEHHGRMVLCSLSPFCAEVLHITHLDAIWEIEATREQAIERLGSANHA
jgi:stage II sporulation protein AA (anti-sigma F factor antagonist)